MLARSQDLQDLIQYINSSNLHIFLQSNTTMPISITQFILFNLVCIQKLSIASSSCIEKERNSLIEFKNSLVDESGRLSSWFGSECCSWKGVICSNKTGHILKLHLHNPMPFDIDRFYNSDDYDYKSSYSKTCLSGHLNSALLDLKNLMSLDLSYNNFSGSEIPKFFGSFNKLMHLNLSVTRFQGNVPPDLGNLSMLQNLDMSDFWNNRLSSNNLGWISNLSSLKHLDLSGVHLGQAKDWLDSVNALPSLTKLNLSNTLVARFPPLSHPKFTSLLSFDLQWNIINSDLPLWLFNITSLLELRLDGNGLYGPIPQDFERLSSLNVLGLSRNFFNDSISDSLFSLRNLSYLDLSQNKFQQKVPSKVVNLCSLKFLDLTQSGLFGEIPDFGTNRSGCLRDLEILRLSYNELNGSISSSIGTLSSLKELDLSNNLLTGSIPSSFGQLPNLERLDLSNNSLSGMLSESHFAKNSKLIELSVFKNNLVFNLSFDWIPPFQLQTVKLTSCRLGPLFPTWLRTQKEVVDLRMSNTGISDILPDWFSQLYSQVHYLDLSKNNISGTLPRFEETNRPGRRLILHSNSLVGRLPPLPWDVLLFDVSNNSVSGNIPDQNGKNLTLEVLILSNNQLSGEFPGFVCQTKGLMILDLANNRFSGRIPDCIGEVQNLAMLDLTNNTFHGEIPNSLTGLSLMSLHLHNNDFQGELPSMANMTFLHVLDVGRNSFTGQIPRWIGENLAFLSLQSNKFEGEIPTTLCGLPQLQLLNIAGNDITGTIPPCFGNFSAMKTGRSSDPYLILDVDYGASILEIVNGIERLFTTTMTFLTSLDLSNNTIVGEIPGNLTQLVGLRNLNLAGNRLTGRIPENIGEMRELISLDLSRNQLSGEMPQSLTSLNFLTHFNVSYNKLTGRVPSGNQLQTLDSSGYLGNEGLCGAPITRRCAGDPVDDGGRKNNEDENDDEDSFFIWFYTGIGPGFITGFLIVCGVLHFVKSFRYAVFQCVDSIFSCSRTN